MLCTNKPISTPIQKNPKKDSIAAKSKLVVKNIVAKAVTVNILTKYTFFSKSFTFIFYHTPFF